MDSSHPSSRTGGGYAMAAPGNLASPGMRIVGGLIDVVVLVVIYGIIALAFISAGDARLLPGFFGHSLLSLAGVLSVVIDVAYFAYFWSSRGASIGMMPFGFKVRDVATAQYPTMSKAALRGFIWTLEYALSFCLVGALGWLWMLWDPKKQAIHDKVAGTIVTTS